MVAMSVLVSLQEFQSLEDPPNMRNPYYEPYARCQQCDKELFDECTFVLARSATGELAEGSDTVASVDSTTQDLRTVFVVIQQQDDVKCAITCSAGCATKAEAALKVQPASAPCDRCGAAGATKRCGNCQTATYCSRECQRKAWKTHKLDCGSKASSSRGGEGDTQGNAADAASSGAGPEGVPNPSPAKKTGNKKSSKKKSSRKKGSRKKASHKGSRKASHLPCSACQRSRPREEYSNAQIKKKGKRKCAQCCLSNDIES